MTGVLTVLWCEEGRRRSAEVEPPFYLGRHPSPPPGFSGSRVYLMRAGSLEPVADLGGPYLTVSRLHAMIDGRGGVVVVRDHGPSGSGSRNGTLVNGLPLPRGGYREARGWCVVGLALSGPRVVVSVEPEPPLPSGVEADAVQVPGCLEGFGGDVNAGGEARAGGEVGSVECLVLSRLGWLLSEVSGRLAAGDYAEAGAAASIALRLSARSRTLLSGLLGETTLVNLEHALALIESGGPGPEGLLRRASRALSEAWLSRCGGEV